MSKSRVKIKVVVIAESEEDSAAEDDTALLSTQDGESGKDFESDESSPVAVETSFRDDQETTLRKLSQVDLLAHCIFCLRKTVPCGNAVPVSQEKGECEMLQVVPRAQLPSSLSSFLNSFNRFLSDLQQVNGNKVRSSSSRRGDENTSGIKFQDLPTMCEFCAGTMEAVHTLYQKLNAELEVLRKIMAESKNNGKYSWRAQQFQKTLRCSKLQRDVIGATTDLLDKLDKTCSIPMSVPASGIEDEDKCATITTAAVSPFQNPGPTFQPLNISTAHETEPNSPSNELSSHDDAGESDCSEEFLINDEGEDDNRADADYIKSEHEDVSSSDNDSTSEEEETRPSARTLRSSSKRSTQSSIFSSSHKASERKLRPNRKNSRKQLEPYSNSSSRRARERLAERKKMEENKTFSTSSDPATGKEIFKCELEGCGAIFKLWASLFNHQHPTHNPNNVCGSCGRAFPTYDRLYMHNKRVQCQEWMQTCDLCKKEIPMEEIYEHVRAHVGEEYLHKCPSPHCKHVYSNAGSLRAHFRSAVFSNSRSCSKLIPNFKEYYESFNMCQVCGHKANNGSSLRGHLHRVHENPNQKNFPCPIKYCPHQFSVKQSVVCHLLEHEMIPDVQTCSQCGSSFNFEEMEEHLKEHHGAEEVFKCSHCWFLFSTMESMLDHLHEHRKRGRLLSCDICGDSRKYSRYSNLREHYFSKHGVGREYPCAECGHISWTQDLATSHTEEQHGEDARNKIPGPAKMDKLCDVCHAVFPTPMKLRDHKIQAHGAEPYRCTICDEAFSSSYLFCRHEWKHGGAQRSEGEFPCDAEGCGRIFKAKSGLRYHLSSVHLGQKQFCDLCGKSFVSRTGLEKHKKVVHLGLRKFVCEICGKAFISKEHQERHKASHSEDRPLGCHICNKKFKSKDYLGKHVKAHRKKELLLLTRKPKPTEFKCDVEGCAKVFKMKHLLQNHVSAVHLGQREHVCELCGKSFSFATTLWTHKSSVHLQIRKFICETCGESFSSGGLLRRHNLIHTGERPYSCDICGQRFRQKEALAPHLASHRSKGADFKPTGPMKHIRKRVQRKKAPSP